MVSRFNEFLTAKLLEGAVDGLAQLGLKKNRIDIFHVPGSFEIPVIVQRALKKKRYSAMITLGVILKGETRPLPANLRQRGPRRHGSIAGT